MEEREMDNNRGRLHQEGNIGTAVYRRELAHRLPAGVRFEAGKIARARLGASVGVAQLQPARAFPGTRQAVVERAVVARFVARVNALGSLSPASPALQARLLEEVKAVAQRIDGSSEAGLASGYDRRVLYEDPGHWSLAAIILRPGQETHPHDHDGWGCAATVQGVERDRRFVHGASGNLVLSGERDYPPGSGYIFDPVDIHQPLGADPRRVTVALHFLVNGSHTEEQRE
jgi:predicted metal-dependent enzyme (double-stranded beta helix superfamily)